MKRITFIIVYSILLLLSKHIFAQIRYNDLSPDRLLNYTAYDSLDFNNDGIIDMKFTQEDSIASQDANGVGITLMHTDIEFIGLAPSYDPSHYYTYKLDSNVFVDDNAVNQLWVTKLGPNDAVRIMQMYFYNVPYHLGEWTNGVVDGFLGFRIKSNSLWHYGWIRMDVDIDAHQLTIKDFAYNLIAKQGIYTGQKEKFSHKNIEVSHGLYFCGNRIFYQRTNIPYLQYDKICRINSIGTLDSIGYVDVGDLPGFTDTDTMTIYEQKEYCVIPVTSDHIEGKSDTIASMFASLDTNSNGDIILNWTPYKNYDFPYYQITKVDTNFGTIILFDTVSNHTLSYTIPSQHINPDNNMFSICIEPDIYNTSTSFAVIFATMANHNLNLQVNPKADFTYYRTYNYNGVLTYHFWDKSFANINRYHWDFGDGDTSNLQSPEHTYNPGTYTVSLTVSNCYGSDIMVKQDVINTIGNTPFNNNSLIIYPNPSSGNIKIESNSNITQINIYSIEGKLMQRFDRVNSKTPSIDISDLNKGLYLIEVLDRNRNWTKIIID